MRVPLGSTGLHVSRLALGTATFGVAPRAEDVDRLLGTALDAGLNLLDTASSYGDQTRFDRPGAPAAGRRESAEELIGRHLGTRRDEVVLCTKVGERIFPGAHGRGLGRTHVRRALERSLRRLRTDHVDVLHAHHHDPDTPVDELLLTFADLVREGSIRHYGISTYAGWQVTEIALRADALGLPRPAVHQVRYSARHRQVEAEVLPACRHLAVPVTAFSPLAGGLLAAGTEDRTHLGSARWQGPGPDVADRRFAGSFRAVAAEHGLDPAVLALAWVLAQDGVVSAVVGPESADELAGLVPAMEVELSAEVDEAVRALDGQLSAAAPYSGALSGEVPRSPGDDPAPTPGT
ncbi:aldo/keto reductase [Nocardioides sp. zg-DK7169]|uniref:aldo/keto reductase n=1 Tax=Nocardioides sp. zg-DK7169 TaxID=2736600 RepID=UPI0015541FF1|nr:aldo/keto reductase [Nocardioides sp. zg-DK7169]